MIGEVKVEPNAQATAEESDRILRRYSNDSLRKENERLRDALTVCEEALDNYADIKDSAGGGVVPNDALYALSVVRRALGRV